MPTYLYGCPECGATKEVWHSMMDNPEIQCQDCPCQMVRRPVLSAVHFKGEGWAHKDA